MGVWAGKGEESRWHSLPPTGPVASSFPSLTLSPLTSLWSLTPMGYFHSPLVLIPFALWPRSLRPVLPVPYRSLLLCSTHLSIIRFPSVHSTSLHSLHSNS